MLLLASCARVSADPLAPPHCDSQRGTYKSIRGDLATIEYAGGTDGRALNVDRVRIYLKQLGFQNALSFYYFIPNGYGVLRVDGGDERSIYIQNVGDWRVAVFGEGSSLWYSERRIQAPDSLWVQVSCSTDIKGAMLKAVPSLR
jgi:hypothetical protein